MTAAVQNPVRVVGRYALYGELASGGMATVHIGRLLGPVGFARTVAIKRLHPQYAKDPEFVSMFLDEARLAARIQHPNVCATLDVVATQGELFLVMEYLQGETLSRMIRAVRARAELIDPRIAVSVLAQTLYGLHAAHEAKSERGEALTIVHRDISPQNVLVGRDGVSKVLDFGVAKAAGRFHTTREGNVKGKLPYMSPEQLRGQPVDRQTDIYAAAVCLWETLTGRKLFKGDNEGSVLEQVLFGAIDPPSRWAPSIPPNLDALVMRGLERDKTKRFQTAREFALSLERAVHPALASDVGDWIENVAGHVLLERAERIAEIESVTDNIPAIGLTEMMSNLDGPSSAVPAPTSAMIGGSSSQVSSISVAAGERGTFENRRRIPLFVGIGAVALSILITAVAVGFMGRNRTNAAAPSTPSASVIAADTRTEATIQASPPTTSETLPSATASASATKPTTTAAAATTAVAHWTAPPHTVPHATATAATADDCKIPYTIGPDGERIYKRQCFK
ncbi:MAG TPA: serine/threonine-protein kinase [Polyangiaceae bacterium]